MENNLIAWSHIFKTLKVFPKYALSREFVDAAQKVMLTPTDFLLYDGSSYVEHFMSAYQKDLVVFDTETTGLDVFHNDIIQIAAIKFHNGRKVGEPFNIILHTEQEIPSMLGDIVNPMVKEYASNPHVDRKEGLQAFLEFVGDCPILGHNVEYDYHILDYNLRRDCGINDLDKRCPVRFDSLKLAHIVQPGLKSYRLKDFLRNWDLSGDNSHKADDDVLATKSVVDFCVEKIIPVLSKQKRFLEEYAPKIDKFASLYKPFYMHTQERLYTGDKNDATPALAQELSYLYETMTGANLLKPLDKFRYVADFLSKDVIHPAVTPTMKEQLNKHIMDLNTYREADLCDSKSMTENIFVSTVHKAKGLEFENVIVCSVVDDVYPFFKNKEIIDPYEKEERIREDARKLYVAISRAKKRLFLIDYQEKLVFSKKWGKSYNFNAHCSPFVGCISSAFRLQNIDDEKKMQLATFVSQPFNDNKEVDNYDNYYYDDDDYGNDFDDYGSGYSDSDYGIMDAYEDDPEAMWGREW